MRAPGLISFGGSHGDGGPGEVDFYLWELPAFVALSACAGAIGALVTRGTSALSRIRTKVSTSSTTRAAEAVAVAALCATCAVAAAAFAGECRSTSATGRDASVAVRLGCGEGEYNDLAALLLGLRDDVIVDLLSAGESYPPAPTPPSVGDGPPRASRERPLTFSARSVAIGLGLTLATMTLASDLSLPAGVFMPTILWGGLLGSLFGELVRYAATETDVRPGGYAIVGSTAALAGVTRGTSALSRIRTKVSTSSTTRAAEAVAVAALCATCAVAAAAFAGECRSTSATGRDASVAVRLGCGEGEYNDLAALLLGLRDDVIVDLLSAGESYPPAPTPPSVGDGPPRASRERPLTFSARSVAIGLGLTLATMTLASDLSLPAGVFMPTILWGGLLGSLFGELVRYAATETDVRPGGYAIVGSTAALAGVFRGSISLVVIMLEGTGRMGYLLPLLVGVAVANLAGAGIGAIIGCDGSFYDQQLAAARVPFLRHHGAPTTAGDVQSPPHSRAGATVAEVMSLSRKHRRARRGFPRIHIFSRHHARGNRSNGLFAALARGGGGGEPRGRGYRRDHRVRRFLLRPAVGRRARPVPAAPRRSDNRGRRPVAAALASGRHRRRGHVARSRLPRPRRERRSDRERAAF